MSMFESDSYANLKLDVTDKVYRLRAPSVLRYLPVHEVLVLIRRDTSATTSESLLPYICQS